MDNVIDIGVRRALRDTDDLTLRNYLWYFNQYECDEGFMDKDIREKLESECRQEAKRRKLEI